MKIFICAILAVLLAGCGKHREPVETEKFVNWFKDHGDTNVVSDSRGVGLANNPTRIQAFVNGAQQSDKSCSVEIEFDVDLPAKGRIVEFVAGSGDTKDKATDAAFANFVMTTMHVIYKAFLNPNDPHQPSKSVVINGATREMFHGNMVQFGEAASDRIDLASMSEQVQNLVAALPLDSGPHWIKVIYSQNQNKPMIVAATLDNNDAPGLTTALENLKWPAQDKFYMVKQFIIIK